MRPKATILTEQELEIMKIVWELGTATVREVYEALRKRRKIAYTTVMTMMSILQQKKHLKRRLEDGAYVYEPRQPREQAINSMVREFVNRVFDGSAQPLLLHLVEDHRVSEQDLREITRIIKERQGGETWAPCS